MQQKNTGLEAKRKSQQRGIDMTASGDVLIVTVTKVESQAVMEEFQRATGMAARPMPIGGRVYHELGELKSHAHLHGAL